MPDRAAKFVSAIFASVLAGASLAAISLNAARAADDCLAAPNAETPAGQSLVLPHRSRHQTPLLVSPDGRRNASANRRAEFRAAPRQSRLRRKPQRRCSARSRTRMPNCLRRRHRTAQAQRRPCSGDAGQCGRERRQQGGRAGRQMRAQSVVASRWLDPSAMSSTLRPPPAPSQTAANVPPAPQTDSPNPIHRNPTHRNPTQQRLRRPRLRPFRSPRRIHRKACPPRSRCCWP